MTIEVSSVRAPEVSASPLGRELETFEERWAAWRAKGTAHDRAVRRKMSIAAPIVILVAGILISVVLAR